MSDEWTSIRIRRTTREHLRQVGIRIARSLGIEPINRANKEPSPQEAVALLLAQWEGRQQSRKKREKRD